MDNTSGMVRNPDHITSTKADDVASRTRETLKSRVIRFAKEAGPGGFIDENLLEIDPSRPESSFRKRRTELAEKNIVVEAGYERKNGHDQPSKVWVHRQYVRNPPPIPAEVVKVSKEQAARADERAKIAAWLRSEEDRLIPLGRDKAARALRDASEKIEAGAHL